MSKPLSEIPPETVVKWTEICFSPKPIEKEKKHKGKRVKVPLPSNSSIPSLNVLRAEAERLRETETPEEIQAIRERIKQLQERVLKEAEELREREMWKGEQLRQQVTMKSPHLFPAETQYECPKCHRKWHESQLNYSIQGRGKHKKRVPFCPICNLKLFSEGSPELKHPIFLAEKNINIKLNPK